MILRHCLQRMSALPSVMVHRSHADADVTVGADDLHELVTLKKISNGLMERIHRNYRLIVGINTSLIVLGVAGVFPPTTSALLHNTSTLLISLKSMNNLLDEKEEVTEENVAEAFA